jgi:hypothetical protein
MMMSEMMKGMSGNTSGGNGMFGNMLPFMMMGGNMGNMFDGMFDFFGGDSEDEDEYLGFADEETLMDKMKSKKKTRTVITEDSDEE